MWENNLKYPLKSYKKQFYWTVASLFAVLVLGLIFMPNRYRAEATGEGAKVFTVFENNNRTSFKTNAKTVREALNEQKITINQYDTVEPSLDDELTGTDYNVNIYRATPATIQDGQKIYRVLTSAKTTRQIAKDAGIKLENEDIIKTELTSKNILETGESTIFKIVRAKIITVNLFGQNQQFRTQADTIADFLEEKNIKLGENDKISLNINTKIISGQSISIWREGKQTITAEESIPFKVEKIEDAEKPTGYRQIKQPGEKGAKTVTYEIEIKKGKEVGRKKISESEIKKPKTQIEIVGKTAALPSGSRTDWMAEAGISPNDYGYVNFIIQHESGWRPTASNNGRYVGLGQTSPANLSRACPNWQSDPVCQLRFFSNYANSRYGGWAQAKAFWDKRGWW